MIFRLILEAIFLLQVTIIHCVHLPCCHESAPFQRRAYFFMSWLVVYDKNGKPPQSQNEEPYLGAYGNVPALGLDVLDGRVVAFHANVPAY
jgi:hypothetical protein